MMMTTKTGRSRARERRSTTTRTSNRTLPQIAKAIKAVEKRGIRDIVEIGKLLHEAEQQCEHGDYMKWIKAMYALERR
jgi:hypothetical protein